ncbi:MAG TPA: xylulose kinase [Spirochaetia bacterium]|nr:xylulose kinase [Spirochaetia bacterium]
MKQRLLAGIDIGTQGVKAAIFDPHGRTVGEGFVRSRLIEPAPGVTEEDPEFQYASVLEALSLSLASGNLDPARITALAVDGQMAGVIGIGEDGRAVTPYDSWLDTRCAPYIDCMRREAENEIIQKTGNPPSFNHGPKILWWRHERPDIYKRIVSFVQPGGYVGMRLCGLAASEAFIDHTYLHFSGFADNAAARWDEALAARFDVPLSQLPRIIAPEDVVGTVSREAARTTGLSPDTVVAAGLGDTAASFLAAGAVREGICVDVAGSAAVFAGTVASFRPDTGVKILGFGRSAVPALWHPYAYIAGGGLNLEWFKDQVAGRRGNPPSLEELSALAKAGEPSPDDPFFIPHLHGRVSPSRPRLRGAWVGLSRAHDLGTLFRAVLEGVALEYGLYAARLSELYPEHALQEVRVTGGGEKSALWNRMKAAVLGVPAVRITGSVGAPAGAALVAGRAVGLFPDLASAADTWVTTGEQTECDPAARAHALRRLPKYEKLLSLLEEF